MRMTEHTQKVSYFLASEQASLPSLNTFGTLRFGRSINSSKWRKVQTNLDWRIQHVYIVMVV